MGTMADARPCAFLGLGRMGAPMAARLHAAGHVVRAWNRSPAGRARWTARTGLEAATSLEAAVAGAGVVALCLGDDPDVRAVFEAMADHLADGAVVIDHTTTSAILARQLHAAAAGRGIGFVDAPVSGGVSGAENGTLTVMAGGDPAMVERVSPLLAAYARRVVHVGPPGAGQLAKMANQIAIAGVVEGLAEAMAFIDANGLDATAVIGAISGGAAQSWQMDNRWQSMSEGRYDFGFAVDWMRKDLRIAMAQAEQAGLALPLVAMVDQHYAQVQAEGGGQFDTSSLRIRYPFRQKR
jgi:3-hydroxyisobutyrate dehydrogenase-like beta-hydroxyacid dehydrogenase